MQLGHREIAARRSQSYWLLSRLFLEQPDTPIVKELALALGAAANEQELGRLRAAVARARQAEHDSAQPDAGPPDHVGTELRFMSLLCFREMEAWRDGDQSEALALLERELSFLDEHVLPWVPGPCDRLLELTSPGFCRAAASLTSAACRRDREEVAALIHADA